MELQRKSCSFFIGCIANLSNINSREAGKAFNKVERRLTVLPAKNYFVNLKLHFFF